MQLEASGCGNDPAQHFAVDGADEPESRLAVHRLGHEPLVQQFLDGGLTGDFSHEGSVHRFRQGDQVQGLPAVGRDAHQLDFDDGGELQGPDVGRAGIEPHSVAPDQVT
ncbi:hypothetical protein D9M72_307590 [compost metagenome]